MFMHDKTLCARAHAFFLANFLIRSLGLNTQKNMKLMKWQKCVNCTNWLPVFRVPFVGARGYEWIVMNLNGLCFGKYIYIPALCSRSWFRQCKQRHVILSSETSRKNKWNVFKPKNRIKQTQNILTKNIV